MRTRSFLSRTALVAVAFSASAWAQDATIYYTTPTIQSGQPVVAPRPVVQAVPVYTPVPVAVVAPVTVDATTAVAPTPATAADQAYLGTPTVQVSQHDASVSFVSGGIGQYEKQWFDAQSNDYAMKVTYADTTGHHLSGVSVTLADAKGSTVLTAITEGPYLLVKTKPGTYTLTSTYQGVSKTSKITVGKNLVRTSVTFADLS